MLNKEQENTSKYTMNKLKSDFLNPENWYRKKRKVTITNGEKIVVKSKSNKPNYVMLFEKNTNFSKCTNSPKKIAFFGEYTIDLNIVTSGPIKVIVYLLEYNESFERVKTNKLKYNGRSYIKSHPEAKFARIAIRLQGKGEVTIKDFNALNYIAKEDFMIDLHPEMKNLKVACIFDEFSMASFKDIVQLITFTPTNWQTVFKKNKPDLLMIESAWKGNNGSWQFEVGNYSNNNQNEKLKQLIDWCRRNRVPTVFWNKEDPVHFEKFKNVASLVDYVFTTDADSIPNYRKLLNHNRVDYLQFAANPTIHHPIKIDKNKKSKISFAGSYYANRHPDRRKDMDDLLNISSEFGLDIFDRNYEVNKNNENSHFRFPKHLQSNVVGTLKYHEIDKAYKDYKISMNVNSVKNSTTMFSRRVYESLASGTPVISSYATGIKKPFGDIVLLLEAEELFKSEIQNLLTDNLYYRKKSMEGMREVFTNHTYEVRMEKVLNRVNIKFRPNIYDVTVLFVLNNVNEFQKALKIIENQSYDQVKVIMLLNFYEDIEELLNNFNNEKISTYIIDYAYKYEEINELIDTKFVTRMDVNHEYGEFYLEDLVHAYKYSYAEIIGKKNIEGELSNEDYAYYEYEYSDSIIPQTALFLVKSLEHIHIDMLISNPEKLIDYLFRQKGCRVFSSDRFNFRL